MGANIMHHLEMNREAEERKRAMMMTRGLATFVEGKSSLQTGDNDSKLSNIPPFPENVQERRFSKETSTDSANAIDSPTASPPLKRATSSNDRSSLNDDHSSPNESSLEKTFSRAAVLLHQSLQLDGDGGVIFFDTKHSLIGSRDRATEKGATSSSTSSGDDDSRLSRLQSGQRERHQMLGHTFQPFSDASTVKTAPMADILGFATTNEGHLELKQTPSPRIFKQLEEVVLMKLMKRYPSGKLWAFDDEGALSSEDEPRYSMNGTFPSLDTDTEAKNGTRRVIEANVLLRCFPGGESRLNRLETMHKG